MVMLSPYKTIDPQKSPLKAEGSRTKQLIHNIPIGQILRLHRNFSTVTDFQSKAEMTEQFQQRGYIFLFGLSEGPSCREGTPVSQSN